MREVLVLFLGGKCSCRRDDCWHEGECSVSDYRCLQLDHINGDGAKDRERLGGPIVRYYFNHLDEAKANLQLLCSNCNWVKRVHNRELRNGVGRTDSEWKGIEDRRILLRMVAYRITESPRFTELVNKYQAFRGRIIESGDTDMMRWLGGIGLDESSRTPLSSNLALRWEKLDRYGSDADSLSNFVRNRIVDLDSLIFTYDNRDRVEDVLRDSGVVENGKGL